ncbi:hypothetical protein RKE29_18735, partial [Streptomyces sp. B1866]|nr:hypothetical protein [Streptomyces sp. B1866]
CGCACHHRHAVSLGLVIGGPSPLTGPAADTPPPPEPEPDPYPEDPLDLEDAEERSHREVTAAWAEKGMRDAGFEPLEPYSGNLSDSWLSQCTTCKRTRRPTLSDVIAGLRCKHGGAYLPSARNT